MYNSKINHQTFGKVLYKIVKSKWMNDNTGKSSLSEKAKEKKILENIIDKKE